MIDINTVTTTDLINLAQDTQRIIVTNKGIAKTANEANISHTATLARELLAACHIGCIDTVLVSLGKVEPKSTDDYRKISPIVSMVVDVYKALKAGTAIRVPAKVTWLVGGEVVKVVRLENVPSLINPNGQDIGFRSIHLALKAQGKAIGEAIATAATSESTELEAFLLTVEGKEYRADGCDATSLKVLFADDFQGMVNARSIGRNRIAEDAKKAEQAAIEAEKANRLTSALNLISGLDASELDAFQKAIQGRLTTLAENAVQVQAMSAPTIQCTRKGRAA